MGDYQVTVHTGSRRYANTFSNVSIKLVGMDGETQTLPLRSGDPSEDYSDFCAGAVSTFTVSDPTAIGDLVLIEVEKNPLPLLPQDQWFLSKVEVISPSYDTYTFPVYRWITDSEVHRFREGRALKVNDDTHPLGQYDRQQELNMRKNVYSWGEYAKGIPRCIKADKPADLPTEVQFSFTKNAEFQLTARDGLRELKLDGLATCAKNWSDMEHIIRVFGCKLTDVSEYCYRHWKDDDFFGYQFLNGVNPTMIKRCSAVPKNFPVDENLISLPCGTSLKDELKNGNIYLCDYKILDGLKANVINDKQQYVAAPLILLHKTPEDKLMPLAIQLKQKPGDHNPIFYPSDSEYDWLTAKVFVRSADLNYQNFIAHLLRTHLLAEVFAVSLLRNLPMVHPLYKLLVPHTRYTLQINILARLLLISPDGNLTKFTSCGGEDMFTLLERATSSITYRSLCIKEDIADRGLETLPNFYYRDDGLKLWDIIDSFVQRILSYYYQKDEDVQRDPELQKWIKDIFEHGFLSNAKSGIPQSFTTVPELVKFVTMVIFTSTVQHSAVNSGQYDYGGWMPNSPGSLQRPPPTTKGTTSEDTLLQTLPDVNVTASGLVTAFVLSKQSSDFVPLGRYPEDHFTEEIPCKLIKEFQGKLEIQKVITDVRNRGLEVPYTYLDPELVENSVAI